jgi:hypothetical protein
MKRKKEMRYSKAYKKWILFASSLPALCCMLAVIDTMTFEDTAKRLEHSFKVGMSRGEVYSICNRMGSCTMSPQYPSSCRLRDRVDYNQELLTVRGRWSVLKAVGVFVCFDELGKLVDFVVIAD